MQMHHAHSQSEIKFSLPYVLSVNRGVASPNPPGGGGGGGGQNWGIYPVACQCQVHACMHKGVSEGET